MYLSFANVHMSDTFSRYKAYKHRNSASYFYLVFICTESRPYSPNLIIYQLPTAILLPAEKILHELAPPRACTTDNPHSHCASILVASCIVAGALERSTPRCAACFARLVIRFKRLTILYSQFEYKTQIAI